MSLNLWDPFFGGSSRSRSLNPWWSGDRRGLYMDPFREMERSVNVLDRFFDDTMNVQLRDHVARLNISDQGDLTYRVDVSGFRPEELNVDVQGNEIVVRGEHREQNEGESVHRQFVRRVVIPEGVQKESIKCDLDNSGRLCVYAKKNMEGSRSIPIGFKQSGEQQQITGGGQQQAQQ